MRWSSIIHLFIGIRELNFPVNSTRPEKCLVKDVDPVCGHENLNKNLEPFKECTKNLFLENQLKSSHVNTKIL